jgi:drug/metabolite transporter (DMT)-like permease
VEKKTVTDAYAEEHGAQEGFTQGMRYMATAAVFFSLMGLLVRLLPGIPFTEIVVFRAAVSFGISAYLLRRSRLSLLGTNRWLLLLRGIFGFLGLSAYFYSIQQLPLAVAVTIQYTNPLFTALFAMLFLREKGSGWEWVAGVLAFGGVLLIARPGGGAMLPAAVGLFGAMCSGVAYVLVRRLGQRGEHPLTIVMYFPLVALVLGAPVAAPTWTWPELTELAALLGVGVTTQIAQVALTKGLRMERAARATLVNYLVIVLSTVYSLLLGERLTLSSAFGMLVIVGAIALVSAVPRRRR